MKNKLLKFRKELSEKYGTGSYLIFKDAELELLLRERPKTMEDLTKIKGFPKKGKRVEAYGAQLVAVINDKNIDKDGQNSENIGKASF